MLLTLDLFAILFAIFVNLSAIFYAILTNFICTKFPSLLISHHDGFQELPKKAPTTSAGGRVEGGHGQRGTIFPHWCLCEPIILEI